MSTSVNLTLDDFLVTDPFYNIYTKRRDESSDFFFVYTDYHQYFQHLVIVWKRIKDEYMTSMHYHGCILRISPDNLTELQIWHAKLDNTLLFLQCDIESFILFARRFLDKVSKLIELIIPIPSGSKPRNSFTGHKKFFLKNKEINPVYSHLLEYETTWYEQDLLLWRDKIFIHGKTLNGGLSISPTLGIHLRKMPRLEHVGKININFVRLKEKYEKRYPEMKISDNPYMMIDEFREEISKRNIHLDEEDLVKLGEVVSSTGTSLDIRETAKHVKSYVENAAAILSRL